MKKLILGFIIAVACTLSASSQNQTAKEKLAEFFFDIHFNVDVEALRTELKSNTNVKLYQDPNRDSRKTIIGTIISDKNLNPLCTDNQFIIQYSSAEAKKNKKVSLKWLMNYKLGDLSSALVDFEKFKSEFNPLFADFTEVKKTGAQKEMINSIILKEKSLSIIITLIQYINFSHTISLEYRDTWKIEQADFLKVKY